MIGLLFLLKTRDKGFMAQFPTADVSSLEIHLSWLAIGRGYLLMPHVDPLMICLFSKR